LAEDLISNSRWQRTLPAVVRTRSDADPFRRGCNGSDVDAFWAYLRAKGFHPESPRDASWGERYFHMADPDGHELSFAHPLKSREEHHAGG